MQRTARHSNQDQFVAEPSEHWGLNDGDSTPRASTPGSNSDQDSEPLFPNAGHYSDKFIDIAPETKTLTLKHYPRIFRLKNTRQIHIPDILSITPASDVHWIGVKHHGLSVTGILWALDWSRGVSGSKGKKSYVIKVKGDTFRLGFSVEHPKKFIEVLEYLHPGITTRTDADQDSGVAERRQSVSQLIS